MLFKLNPRQDTDDGGSESEGAKDDSSPSVEVASVCRSCFRVHCRAYAQQVDTALAQEAESREAQSLRRFEHSLRFVLDPKAPLKHMMWDSQVRKLRVGHSPVAVSPVLAVWNKREAEWVMVLPDKPSRLFPLHKLLPYAVCVEIWKFMGRNIRKICQNALREQQLNREYGTSNMKGPCDAKDIPLYNETAFHREVTDQTIGEMLRRLPGNRVQKWTLCYAYASGDIRQVWKLRSAEFVYITSEPTAALGIDKMAQHLAVLSHPCSSVTLDEICRPCSWDSSWVLVREFQPCSFPESSDTGDEDNDQEF